MTLQDEVAAWCAETFVGQTLEGKLAHLWEELHEAWEFARIIHHRDSPLCVELADCALLIMEIASLSNVVLHRPEKIARSTCRDFESAIREKFAECLNRKWQKADDAGIFHHEKDSSSGT
jgi:hypothetical protein